MGIVIDPEKAKSSTCTCYVFGDPQKPEDRLCFVSGIIGTLSDAQEREYCSDNHEPILLPATEKQKERVKKFKIIGEIMHTCLESEEEDFLACVERMVDKLKEEK